MLIFLPGLLCDAASFAPQLTALAPLAQLRVADFSGLSSLRAMAQRVLDTAPPKFSVVGHSMGGRVALELLHLAPERIERVCLMDIGVHALMVGEASARMAIVEQAEHEGMDWLTQWWLDTFVIASRRQDAALIQTLQAMVSRHTLADYRNQITAAVTREDQAAYLAGINQEVLLVCGAQDAWSTPEQHQEIARALPLVRLELIDGAGHMPTVEAPERVNALLTRWWTSPLGSGDRNHQG